ncbi:MAG: hypothetical protein HYV06_07575 [Deltaproteobacteria bacterium]|nr:hypothetical protein [Deltaproteobacteria bacterium]
MTSRCAAFILYGYPLGVSTMVINSIIMFARRGYAVDVVIDRENYETSPIYFTEPNVNLIFYRGNGKFLVRLFQFASDRLKRFSLSMLSEMAPFSAALLYISPMLFAFSRWLRSALPLSEYDFIIPVDYRSLVALHSCREKGNIVYYDMELMDWKENCHLYQNKLYWKKLEHRMICQIGCVAIQSEPRAELFAEINRYTRDRIHLLPVASMGEPIVAKSDFFRRKFGIPPDQTIVIYSGNFREWAYCLEIIESARFWPDKFSLVMHTWKASNVHTAYFAKMKRAATGVRVYLSTEYLEPEALAPALSSADIALMFYRPIDGNFTEIMHSSNKLGEYLKAGLPVICSNFETLREFVTGHGIGVPISSLDDLPQALWQVTEQLPTFRLRALDCYQRNFRFEPFFERFYSEIAQVADN